MMYYTVYIHYVDVHYVHDVDTLGHARTPRAARGGWMLPVASHHTLHTNAVYSNHGVHSNGVDA